MVLVGAGVGIRTEASPRGDRVGLSVLHAVGWQPPRPPVHPEDKGAVKLVVLAFVAATPAPPGKPDYPTPTSHPGVCSGGGFTEAPPLRAGDVSNNAATPVPPPLPPSIGAQTNAVGTSRSCRGRGGPA